MIPAQSVPVLPVLNIEKSGELRLPEVTDSKQFVKYQ